MQSQSNTEVEIDGPAPEAHSSTVGGSTAGRRIACPRSYQLEQKLPIGYKEETSVYAEEGTALHALTAKILDEDMNLEDFTKNYIGTTMSNGAILNMDLINEAIAPAISFFDELIGRTEGEGEFDFIVEASCEMPGVPGAFGTSDVIARTGKRSIIIDWKFGSGVPVYANIATQFDEAGEPMAFEGNPQLMFYGRAAMFQHPEMFEKDPEWPVELYIVQPRIGDDWGASVSRYSATVGELEEFRQRLIRAMAEAMGATEARIAKGDHCKWAPCKLVCPLYVGAILDLSKLEQDSALSDSNIDVLDDTEYGELLASILELREPLEAILAEAAKLAASAIDEGVPVPGWKLEPKRAGHPSWKADMEAKVDAYLGRAGLSVDERRVVKPISPAVARKALKAIGKELNEDRYVEPGKSSGFNLKKDPTGEGGVSTAGLVADFAAKIEQLTGI